MLPGRIPPHDIEAPRPAGLLVRRGLVPNGHAEDVGEGEVPVEEPVLSGQPLDLLFAPGGQGVGILADVAELFVGDGWAHLSRLFPDEGSAPGVSPEQSVLVGSRFERIFAEEAAVARAQLPVSLLKFSANLLIVALDRLKGFVGNAIA